MKTENLTLFSQPKHYSNLSNNRQRFMSNENSVVSKSVNKTAVGMNPNGRLSFKGASAALPVAKTFAEKVAVNKYFNKFLDILVENSLIADALIALGLTAIVRPASIYAIPTKDPVEKKKNNYQVAHSISTGLLGLGTTLAIAEPIKRGVKKVLANPKKYMKNDTSYVTENSRVFKETAGRLHQPIFLPLRAMLTIAIVRPILESLGLSKTGKPLKSTDKAKIDYSFMNFKGNDTKTTFAKFANVSMSTKQNSNNPSFKGAQALVAKGLNNSVNVKFLGEFRNALNGFGEMITEGLAKGVGKIADTKGFRKFIEWFKERDKWFPHLIAAESLWLSGFYMYNTGKSNKIEKDQKLPMILNQGITALLCTWGAYKVDGVVNKQLDKFKTVYKRMHPTMEQKVMDNKLLGIRLLGPIVIFTTIYRFVGPVIVTPFANWLSEKIQPHKKAA